MAGDDIADSNEPEVAQRYGGRRQHAVALIAVATMVAVAASVAYLNPSGASLVGILAARFATPTPADYRPPGGPFALLAPTPASTSTPSTRGFLRRGAIRAVIERFGGMNDQPASSMIASVGISDPAVINSVITQLNGLPPFPGGVHCAMDDGSYFELIFTYVDGTKVSVKVEASGCGEVFVEGSTQPVAWTATSPQFVATLEGLLAHLPSGY